MENESTKDQSQNMTQEALEQAELRAKEQMDEERRKFELELEE